MTTKLNHSLATSQQLFQIRQLENYLNIIQDIAKV